MCVIWESDVSDNVITVNLYCLCTYKYNLLDFFMIVFVMDVLELEA